MTKLKTVLKYKKKKKTEKMKEKIPPNHVENQANKNNKMVPKHIKRVQFTYNKKNTKENYTVAHTRNSVLRRIQQNLK